MSIKIGQVKINGLDVSVDPTNPVKIKELTESTSKLDNKGRLLVSTKAETEVYEVDITLSNDSSQDIKYNTTLLESLSSNRTNISLEYFNAGNGASFVASGGAIEGTLPAYNDTADMYEGSLVIKFPKINAKKNNF